MARREVVAGDPRRAVAYLRVSTEDQNLGPEAQRAQIEAWSVREGVEVLAWHEDHGISGAKDVTARPALAAALAALRREGAGVLVVAKRDRIARDVLIAGTVDHLAGRAGARVVSADGIGNGDSPADQFMRTILDGASAFERSQIRARTRAALAVKKTRGERVGGVPWGWRVAEDGVQLVPHEGERATAARAQDAAGGGAVARAGRGTARGRGAHHADGGPSVARRSPRYSCARHRSRTPTRARADQISENRSVRVVGTSPETADPGKTGAWGLLRRGLPRNRIPRCQIRGPRPN